MSCDPGEIHVLIPDKYSGYTVCSVSDLYSQLLDTEDMDEAILAAGIESGSGDDLHARVRALNETGDAKAFWGMT